ncbi:MAG: BCCT family transporter [Endomicrobiaceae bacterium]|nr:BCCT family transporter [Endomicrobiaceae bacterium]
MKNFFKTIFSQTKVFYISIVLLICIFVLGTAFPSEFQVITKNIRTFISNDLGWYYLLLVTGIVIVCLFFIINPVGQIRLGDPKSQPEHSLLSWIAMLFSAGMGIGLVFWGTAEPLSHYAISSPVADPGTKQAFEDAIKYSYFHWGIHAWAIYGIVALALAYFQFRKKESILISTTLKPLFGQNINGTIKTIVDTITIFATVIGIATTLGFGAIQINGGLAYLMNIPESLGTQFIIIAVTTVLFLTSAMLGLNKGIKTLSNFNIFLAFVLLVLVIIIGPTINIMNNFVDSIGSYLQGFFRMSFRTAAYDSTHNSWIQQWTIFYWAWWLSWTPFVGLFIARISKGRTIREFLICVLLVPTLLSMIWFAAFGTLAIQAFNEGAQLISLATEEILFGTFAHYPLALTMSVIAVFLIFTFFITSADSAVYVLSILSENGGLYPSKKTKLIWGLAVSFLAGLLLAIGGLKALQDVLIIVALPFSVIILLMMIALYIELEHERKQMGLYIKPDTYPEKDKPFRSYEEQESN